MTKNVPGHAVYQGLTLPKPTDGTVEPGDIVEINGDGQVTEHAEGEPYGVVSDQAKGVDEEGELIDVHVAGVVITAVPGGTADGDAVAGIWVADSDEGGRYRQHETVDASLDDGYAAVHLR